MKKFLQKAKDKLDDFQDQHESSAPSQDQQAFNSQPTGGIQPPTPSDVLRYRYHHGVNLGAIFVLEQWLFGSMYPPSSAGASELDAISASLKESGFQATREKWENHWRNALSDEDLGWFVNEARGTSIRLPIGYFTFGKLFAKGTDFEEVCGTGVYDGAWEEVKGVVKRARGWGVGVLVDLHALPGAANGDAHSGISGGKAGFWESRKHKELATRCVLFVLQELVRDREFGEGVVGVQVVNEAVWDAKGIYGWYEDILQRARGDEELVRGGGAAVPVYVSDGWDLERALRWTNGLKGRGWNPVVVDTHRYYTFSDEDRSKAPHELIEKVKWELSELGGKEGSLADRGEAQLVVGEYSCVMDGQTWGRVADHEKEGHVRGFGETQSWMWQQKAGGSYFWTWKMEWMDGGEWGFVEQVKKGNVRAPENLRLSCEEVRGKVDRAQQVRGGMKEGACGGHERYWNETAPGQRFEHERYGMGWDTGFSDAVAFWEMGANGGLGEKARDAGGADKIGCLDIWVKKRLAESGQNGEFAWEWEQGFRAGVKAFYEC